MLQPPAGSGLCIATNEDDQGILIPCACPAAHGSTGVPLCPMHLELGDPSLQTVQHENPELGTVLVAARDLPAGYRLVYWGTLTHWKPDFDGADHALELGSNHVGVIDPTPHRGSLAQYASSPGPDESRNLAHVKGLIYGACNNAYHASKKHCTCNVGSICGRELHLVEPTPKNTLLLWHYRKGSEWFAARGIERRNVGMPGFPAPPAPRFRHDVAKQVPFEKVPMQTRKRSR